jgi:glutamate N-acetyltransferase / amino-acid N-acetyltransferase
VSVTAPAGFVAAGIACGIKASGAPDLSLVATADGAPAPAAAVFTQNKVAAAPVQVSRAHLAATGGRAAAVVLNSGNANAATGEQGYRDALAMRDAAAEALNVEPKTVAVAETGTIGVPLDIEAVTTGVLEAAEGLSAEGGDDFAQAIMTTDRGPKRCTVRTGGVTLSAQAKGAGMIEPGFATMLCFLQTDAEVADPDGALRSALGGSMERITVDGQMSTNDTVLLQATGTAGAPLPEELLDAVLLQLALQIVADGEGASRVGRVEVTTAADEQEAERVARAIANSPLVKTALFGRDSNWGRIAQAAGMALAGEELDELGPDRIQATELASDQPEAELSIRLGRGDARAHVYFSDLTHDYIRINAEYTT